MRTVNHNRGLSTWRGGFDISREHYEPAKTETRQAQIEKNLPIARISIDGNGLPGGCALLVVPPSRLSASF